MVIFRYSIYIKIDLRWRNAMGSTRAMHHVYLEVLHMHDSENVGTYALCAYLRGDK